MVEGSRPPDRPAFDQCRSGRTGPLLDSPAKYSAARVTRENRMATAPNIDWNA